MATMNLADPELELVDPTPNVHSLFMHFDKLFFWAKLHSRAVVRWSKRMYSCAGVCSYDCRGGLCDIALSEPLLKLRPRKDLVETLLHEMIHAFLFVTNRDQDRDGHGPNFKAHMYRINKSAGLNISIYHDFHDEVKLYQTHWWRCNGTCQRIRPHFGIVRRTANRAPGPSDSWWNYHKMSCGGTFIKIKEPENKSKKVNENKNKKNTKANGDITKYVNKDNAKSINNLPDKNRVKPALKDSNINTINTITKPNSSSFVVGKKGVGYNPTAVPKPSQTIPVFTGSGNVINSNKHLSDSSNVTAQVRNIWANKEIPAIKGLIKKPGTVRGLDKIDTKNAIKHKGESIKSPPAKIKKIDDYFKANETLQDLYGDYKLTKGNDKKLVAIKVEEKIELVACPICNDKIDNRNINKHLDECLNKDIIGKLSQETHLNDDTINRNKLNNVELKPIPAFKGKQETINNNIKDLTNKNLEDFIKKEKTDAKITTEKLNKTDPKTINRKPNENIRRSDNFVSKERGDSYMIKVTKDIKEELIDPSVKTEPGTSKDEFDSQICPCCGNKFNKPVEEHLDECLVFFDNNTTIPEEGASTSLNTTTIVIDDDDIDESQEFNETGTKCPCPCCMKMVEQADMNDHLDVCLGLV